MNPRTLLLDQPRVSLPSSDAMPQRLETTAHLRYYRLLVYQRRTMYLTKGQCLLISRPPFTVTIVCASTQMSTTVHITRPLDTITLQPECAASGDSFYLPPYYASETHLELPAFDPSLSLDNASIPIWRSEWSIKLSNISRAAIPKLPALHITGMQADTYFDRLEAQPLEQVTVDSPSSFSKFMLLTIIIAILSFFLLAFLLKHCCSRRSIRLYRFRSARPTTPPALAESPDAPEPAIEMQETVPMVSPPPHPPPYASADHGLEAQSPVAARAQQLPAVQDVSPPRGDAPPTTAYVESALSGARPTARVSLMV